MNLEKKIKIFAIIFSGITLLTTIFLFLSFRKDAFFRVSIDQDPFYAFFFLSCCLLVMGIMALVYFKTKLIIEKKKEIILLLVIILLFVLLFEIFLRMTLCDAVFNFYGEENMAPYKHKPNMVQCRQIKDENLRFYKKSNSEGFLDDEFNASIDSYNIFLVGDSMAYCAESPTDSCVHRKLEKDLKEEYGDSVQVLNFGISGYGAIHEFNLLKEYIPKYNPDLILLYVLSNDLLDNTHYIDGKFPIPSKSKIFLKKFTPKSFVFFARSSREIFKKTFPSFYNTPSNHSSEVLKFYNTYKSNYDEEWNLILDKELETLQKIYDYSSSFNIPVVFILLGSPEQVYTETWEEVVNTYSYLEWEEIDLDRPNKDIMEYAKNQGWIYIDLLSEFREVNETKLHWPIDSHWNPAGQEFASEKIEFFLKEGILKELVQKRPQLG